MATGEVIELRPSRPQRALFAVGGVGFGVLCLACAMGDPWFLAFVPLAPVLVLDGVRTGVVVDRERGVVAVTRAIRRRELPLSAITGVDVPRTGPLVITLDPGHVRATTRFVARTFVSTGLYAPRRGQDPVARALARAIGAPLTGALVRPLGPLTGRPS